jgi:carbon-monoxide dehydrogenase large subunit
MSGGLIGRSVPRLEDGPLLRGTARFLDDLHAPGTLEAAFLRSPLAHGRLRGIDTAAARAMPGVVAVLTLADLRPLLTNDRLPLQFRNTGLPDAITPFVLAHEEVLFVGEAIALVIADSRAVAEDAADAVEVDIEELPAVADVRAGVAPGAPRACSARDNVYRAFEVGYGDADAGFAGAACSVALDLDQHRGAAHPMEGRGILALPDPLQDRLQVWSSTQLSHEARHFLADLLGLDETRIDVTVPEVGGGFGAKYLLYPEEVAVAAAARLLGRPVKWVEDRREHFLAAIQERDQHWRIEAAADAEGRLLAIRGEMVHDAGAYIPQGINLAYNAATAVPGPYVLPAYRLAVTVGATNKVATIPVRGAGYPEGTFAMERALDAIADRLGLDRVEVRRRNLIPAEAMPYATPLTTRSGSGITYDTGDFPAILDRALAAIDHAGFSARAAAAAAEGRALGLGIACGIKGTGRGPYESAIVRIGRSGRVSLHTGAMPMGQGVRTAMAQVCAETLGLRPEDITVVCGDTRTIPLGMGGFASRQTVVAGSSVHRAAEAVRAQVLTAAAALLEVAPEELVLEDGHAALPGRNRRVSLREVAELAAGSPGYALPPGVRPGLEAQEAWMPSGLTYGMGAHAVELEVDRDTGLVRLLRYVVVNDCGRAINPQLVIGQLHGGVVHGIGNALFEFMGYDEQAQPTTTTFADYLLPTVTEIPLIDAIIVEYPTPTNPLGVKGVGEAGCLPVAAAIVSAVEQAVGLPHGTIRRVPLSPPDLLRAMGTIP